MNICRNVFSNFFKTTLKLSPEGVQYDQFRQVSEFNRLRKLHVLGPKIKPKVNTNPFGEGIPFMKGVVLKTLIKKPRKPNSANRKCVMVRLTNGKEMVAYIPGIGHNLQEHNIVLCEVGGPKDTPGVFIRCVRGKHDLPHVIKAEQ